MTLKEKIKFIADSSGKTSTEVKNYFEHHADSERGITAMYEKIVEQQGDHVHE